MREPARNLKSALPQETSLLGRIRENLCSVWGSPRVSLAALPASGAGPIRLLETQGEKTSVGAQAGSTLAHILLLAALAIGATGSLVRTPAADDHLTVIPREIEYRAAKHAPGLGAGGEKTGGGGSENRLPPTTGQLAPLARVVLAPPRLPDRRVHPLPVEVTMYDPEAPEITAPVRELGLPWMRDKDDSAGPGRRGIGNNPGGGMGRNGTDGEGGDRNSELPYGNVASQVSCKYCPDPAYSDQARQEKLQGTVTLRVLVGPDGRAKEIRITHGLGMGLDENAVSAVRSWQFIPAKDASRRPVASWITIETLFRLY